jgi:hypothetical protein
VTADFVVGLFFLAGGLIVIVFRSPLLRLTKRQLDEKWSPRLRPTDRFVEVQHTVGAVLFIAFGVLLIAIALL